MTYAWEIFARNQIGIYANMTPRVMGIKDAGSAEEVADLVRPQLSPGQELNIWDHVGVGRKPVLSIEA